MVFFFVVVARTFQNDFFFSCMLNFYRLIIKLLDADERMGFAIVFKVVGRRHHRWESAKQVCFFFSSDWKQKECLQTQYLIQNMQIILYDRVSVVCAARFGSVDCSYAIEFDGMSKFRNYYAIILYATVFGLYAFVCVCFCFWMKKWLI